MRIESKKNKIFQTFLTGYTPLCAIMSQKTACLQGHRPDDMTHGLSTFSNRRNLQEDETWANTPTRMTNDMQRWKANLENTVLSERGQTKYNRSCKIPLKGNLQNRQVCRQTAGQRLPWAGERGDCWWAWAPFWGDENVPELDRGECCTTSWMSYCHWTVYTLQW